MDQPHIQTMNQVEWNPHPTIPGVLTKIFENGSQNLLADVLLARVEVSGEIPWHIHEQASETAYVLTGEAVLKYAPSANREDVTEVPLPTATLLTIPAGWWHTVVNVGSIQLELFAFHTPPTF